MRAKEKAFELGRERFGGVLFTIGAFVFGVLFALRFAEDTRIVTDEIVTQLFIYVPGAGAAVVILFAFLVLWSAKDIDSEKEAKLVTVKAQFDTVTRRIEEKEKLIGELEGTIEEKESSHLRLQRDWGRWRLKTIGFELKPKYLLVSVQFIALEDNRLAHQIRSYFVDDGFGSAWKTDDDIEQINFRRNPSKEARVVVFSNHDVAGGIRAALDNCALISETVELYRAETDMLSAITIIVFPNDQEVSS